MYVHTSTKPFNSPSGIATMKERFCTISGKTCHHKASQCKECDQYTNLFNDQPEAKESEISDKWLDIN